MIYNPNVIICVSTTKHMIGNQVKTPALESIFLNILDRMTSTMFISKGMIHDSLDSLGKSFSEHQ